MKKILLCFLLLTGWAQAQTGVNIQKIGGTPVPTIAGMPGVLPVFNVPTPVNTATRTPTPLPAGSATPTLVPTATATKTPTPQGVTNQRPSNTFSTCFDGIVSNVVNAFTIRGSSAGPITIKGFEFSTGPSGSTTGQVFSLHREATPSTGGDATSILNHLIAGPTPGASAFQSTAGSSITAGTSLGKIRWQSQNRATGGLQQIPIKWYPMAPEDQGFILRSQFDSLTLSIDATAGVSVVGCVEWTEAAQ